MDDLHPVGSAFVSDHEAERIEEARRIVLLRSALYLSVPCGEYVVFRRLMALEQSASPDRRLGLPRWALRALFGIRSKVVAEMEGNALVVSTVLSAEFE
jgi:hypothetical protein